ncbi:hypothetical protein [Fibrobacter sp.]|uniref:hypothetical protein n=1 Tax=Fibrobacter sp. TaxID=35828 RepID=UPI00386FE1FF
MNIKSFDDLDITDPIMFGLVFSNKHIAQPFIEHLLDIKIDHLETPVPEAVLSYDAEHKGVRLIWKCSSVQNERHKIMLA